MSGFGKFKPFFNLNIILIRFEEIARCGICCNTYDAVIVFVLVNRLTHFLSKYVVPVDNF